MKSLTIEQAAALILAGQIVAFPTETVYGLGASIFQPEAIARIYAVKKRPIDNPLIAHIASLQDLQRIAVDLPKRFFALYARFFPGPLTLVLRKHPQVPGIVSAGQETIAIRMPAHPLARQLIQMVGQPLVAPSANLSGKPSGTHPSHIWADFNDRIAGIIDGGACTLGIESTVLSLIHEEPVILRPGLITKAEIEEVLAETVRERLPTDAVSSPGMKYRHYAPKAKVRLFSNIEQLLQKRSSRNSWLLSTIPIHGEPFYPLSCEQLYHTLRLADDAQVEEICVLCDVAVQSNTALMHRLQHAAED